MCAAVYGGTEYAPVAQLDRAIASDAMCRAFESHQVYHIGASYILLAPIFACKNQTVPHFFGRFSLYFQFFFDTVFIFPG